MRKNLLPTIFVSMMLLVAGSIAASASQTSVNVHHKRFNRQQSVTHPSSDITSFSSSSVLHIGVNRPPKNK